MRGTAAPADPFLMKASNPINTGEHRDTRGLKARSKTINTSRNNLVLIIIGQSLFGNTLPTWHPPINTSKIDQLNINDGNLYEIPGPLLGCGGALPIPGGNLAPYIADLAINNGAWDHVYLAAATIGGTMISEHTPPQGQYSERHRCVMRRFAAMGIVPGLSHHYFVTLYGQGETDVINGTTSLYAGYLSTLVAGFLADGINRLFVEQESFLTSLGTNATVRAAQAAIVNGTTIFAGADTDVFTGTVNRQVLPNQLDHFTDNAAPNVASAIYTKFVASGAPFF